MEISYRRVNLADIKEIRTIAEIDVSIPPRHDPDFIFDEKAIQDQVDFYQKKVTTDDFFEVALVNDVLVGYHLVRKVPYQRDLFAGCVYTLWVSAEFRRKGIGSALKARGESWARGLKLDHIFTWVHSQNMESIALNKDLGYEVTHYKLRKKLD